MCANGLRCCRFGFWRARTTGWRHWSRWALRTQRGRTCATSSARSPAANNEFFSRGSTNPPGLCGFADAISAFPIEETSSAIQELLMTTYLSSLIRSVAFCSAASLAFGVQNAKPAASISVPILVTCQVFVATNGNDANPGTATQPFATLDRARDYVRATKAGATEPIEVCLRGGTYQLQHTFTLGPDDSGTAAAP